MAATLLPDAGSRLAALKARIYDGLDRLGDCPPNWVPALDGIDKDVVIIGAGQAGLAIGFALKREGVTNIAILDAQPAGQEGPWVTYGQMETLRSPKTLQGPELGLPALTFRAWHEAAYGEAAYDALGKIPTRLWMDYLLWYRDVADLPIRNDTQVTRIEPVAAGLRLSFDGKGDCNSLTTRKVVLATGMDGFGRARIPEVVRDGLPRDRYAHCREIVDFESLRGKRIAVLGAASSAFDYSATALEHGAARVDLFCRGDRLYDRNRFKQINYAGIMHHYVDLDDADRWRIMSELFGRAVAVTRETLARNTRHDNFHIHLNAGWDTAQVIDGAVRIKTVSGAAYAADFVIVGAGFENAPEARPELAGFADKIARWQDRFPAPEGQKNPGAAAFPYLGREFQLQDKQPGAAPWLQDIHLYNWAGTVSHGRGSSENSSLRFGLPRLISALIRDIVRKDAAAHVARILDLPEPEFRPDEYRAD